VKKHRKVRGPNNQPEVFEEALNPLKDRDLENAYRDAAEDDERTNRAWDITTSDGLPSETW